MARPAGWPPNPFVAAPPELKEIGLIDGFGSALIFVIPALLVLTVVVTVHEFGHFLAARACGVKVDRFSIGFGKALLSRTDKRGVEWRLGWIPLGGYVRFAGDESAASVPDHEDLKRLRAEVAASQGEAAVRSYFHFKPVWQRSIVVAAGPFANFVLSTVLFAGVFLWLGQAVAPVQVLSTVADSPAARAGILPGDRVLEADGKPLKNFEDLKQHVALRAGVPITLLLQRGVREVVVNVTPDAVREEDALGVYNRIGAIGVRPDPRVDYQRVRLGPMEALGAGAGQTWEVLATTTGYLVRLVQGKVPADQLGGVLRIGHTAGGYTKLAVEGDRSFEQKLRSVVFTLVQLTAFISVSIGFMNLLPVPVLDGGHLLFYAYEAVARRPLAARVQEAGYRLGLAMLVGLMLFATWNDVQTLGVFQFLGGLVT